MNLFKLVWDKDLDGEMSFAIPLIDEELLLEAVKGVRDFLGVLVVLLLVLLIAVLLLYAFLVMVGGVTGGGEVTDVVEEALGDALTFFGTSEVTTVVVEHGGFSPDCTPPGEENAFKAGEDDDTMLGVIRLLRTLSFGFIARLAFTTLVIRVAGIV